MESGEKSPRSQKETVELPNHTNRFSFVSVRKDWCSIFGIRLFRGGVEPWSIFSPFGFVAAWWYSLQVGGPVLFHP
jgi:hypothetical protein